MDIDKLINDAGKRLVDSGISNGRQEARWLINQLLDEMSYKADAEKLTAFFNERIARRLNGEPLQYIMKNAAFHCIDLEVGPGVLIPRPETEQLVEIALKKYSGKGDICDLCTGSGAIALALAKQLPNTRITGIDISEDALHYAQLNKQRLNIQNTEFLLGDLFAPLPKRTIFSLVTANPPYISGSDYENLEPTVKNHEPKLALYADDNGLAVLKRIADQVVEHLSENACFISEIGDEQGAAAIEIFRERGFTSVHVEKDYSDKDRFLIAETK